MVFDPLSPNRPSRPTLPSATEIAPVGRRRWHKGAGHPTGTRGDPGLDRPRPDAPLVNAPVGRQATNDPNDVAAVEGALNQTGDLYGDPTGYFGERTEDAVKRVQARNGLDQSGTVTPDDDTETALRAEAAGNRDPFFGAGPDRPSKPGTDDSGSPVREPDPLTLARSSVAGNGDSAAGPDPLSPFGPDARGNRDPFFDPVPMPSRQGGPRTPSRRPNPLRRNLVEASEPNPDDSESDREKAATAERIGIPPYDRDRDRMTDVPPVPDAKIKDVGKYNWHVFHEGADKEHGISKQRRKIYGDLFAFEGGAEVNSGSSAYGGIMPNTLAGLQEQGRLPNVPKDADPKDLPVNALPKVYDAFFDDAFRGVGGHKALDKIPDEKTAAAVADSVFRYSPSIGTEHLQKAMNRVSQKNVATDQIMGPNTLEKIREIAKDPERRTRFREELSQIRKEYERKRDGPLGGDETRFDYFRFQNDDGS